MPSVTTVLGSVSSNPHWMNIGMSSAPGYGVYSPELLRIGSKARGYRPPIAKHTRTGVPELDAVNNDDIALRRDQFERYTIAGVAKHIGGLTPLGLFFGQDTHYNIARSDTWNTQMGMRNTPSYVVADTVEHLSSGQDPAVWNYLAKLETVPVDMPDTYMWSTSTYEPTMALLTSARGPGAKIDASKDAANATLNIYKSVFSLFENFANTPQGTFHGHHGLLSLATSFTIASHYEAAVQLNNADAEYQSRLKSAANALPTIDSTGEYIAAYWAYFQTSSSNKLADLRTSMQNVLRTQHGEGNEYSWVLTKACYDLLAYRDERSAEYSVGGQRALDRKEMVRTAWRTNHGGDDIAIIMPFTLPGLDFLHPLGHMVEISEHIPWIDTHPEWSPAASLNRRVFDQRCGFVDIPYLQAYKNLYCLDDNGDVKAAQSPSNITALAKEHSSNKGGCFPYKAADGAAGVPDAKEGIPSFKDVEALFRMATTLHKQMETGTVPKEPTPATKGRPTAEETREIEEYVKNIQSRANLPGILGIMVHMRYFAENALYIVPGKVLKRLEKPGIAIIADRAPDMIHEITMEKRLGTALIGPKYLAKAPNVNITFYEGGATTTPLTFNDTKIKYDPNNKQYGSGDMLFVPLPNGYKVSDLPININLHGITDVLREVYAPAPEGTYHNAIPGWIAMNEFTKWRESRTGDPTRRTHTRGNHTAPFPVSVISRCAAYYSPDSTGAYTVWNEGNGYWKAHGTYQLAITDRIGHVFKPQFRGAH